LITQDTLERFFQFRGFSHFCGTRFQEQIDRIFTYPLPFFSKHSFKHAFDYQNHHRSMLSSNENGLLLSRTRWYGAAEEDEQEDSSKEKSVIVPSTRHR
jgi:hypothetical protein